MLILTCVALALLVVPLAGGRWAAIAAIPWRHRWLLPVALVARRRRRRTGFRRQSRQPSTC